MPIDQPFSIYREQISSQYHGLALWDPNPVQGLFKDPDHVSIGDVGYLDNGAFMRIFNAKLPQDHPTNQFIKIPETYKPLRYFDDVRRREVHQEEYSSHVSKVDNIRANIVHDEHTGQTYECWARSHGALLSLPYGARSEDVIRPKLFEDYMRDNVDSWLRWSKKEGLPVESMEDLIFVTGCTLAKSWAAAAFDGIVSRNEEVTAISLEAQKFDGGGTQFVWRNIRGSIEYHHRGTNIENQCVFIRGFRAKRNLFGIRLYIIRIGSSRDEQNSQRSQYRRNNGSHNAPSTLGNDSIRVSSSSLDLDMDTIPPIINDENPQRSPYSGNDGLHNTSSFLGNDPHFGGSTSSLKTIGPPINHENPQLHPYPSSTAIQSNGDLRDPSFMTSPSDSSLFEVPNKFEVESTEFHPAGHDRLKGE